MGYEDDNGVFFGFRGYGWAALGILFDRCGLTSCWITPFLLVHFGFLARSNGGLRCCCCCCCADETRVCRATRRVFYTPQDRIDFGVFFFRISNVEHFFF
jgi:hypothetical protein